MSIGHAILRQEAYERAMANYRAKQAAREQRRTVPAEKRRPALGRGARRISKEEAVAMIAKKNPRGALRLLAEHFGGPTKRSQ